MATANTPQVTSILDGTPSASVIEGSRSVTPSPINSSGTTLMSHTIIHEQEDLFIDIKQGDAKLNRLINLNNVHLFNIKKRSKRSSSTSSDARDRFKSRSISDSNSIEIPQMVHHKSYSLDSSNKFTQNLLEFTHDIKFLNSNNFINLMNWYYSHELPPVDKMFPWLHGLHKYNMAQRRFLLQNIVDYLDIDPYKIPLNDLRFLTLVRSSCMRSKPIYSLRFQDDTYEPSTGLLKGTISIEEILMPLQSENTAKLKDSINSAFIMLGLSENTNFNRELILQDCKKLNLIPTFKEMDPPTGVNLRNFHIQTSKISHISDFIIYCFNEHTDLCECHSVARLLRIAQLRYEREFQEIPPGRYNCFILKGYDPFKDVGNLMSIKPVLRKDCGLVPNQLYEKLVFNDWNNNILFKEKLEISKMSSATHVYRNVWFGNASDFNAYHCKYSQEAEDRQVLIEQSPLIPNDSPPLYCLPENTITTLTASDVMTVTDFDELLITRPKQNWKLFVNCYNGATFPTLVELKEYLIHSLDDYYDNIYLEFPPSGSIQIGDLREDKISSIVNLCKLLYFKCGLNDGIGRFSGLIYCSDGYSETSLLGLCYLIYSQGLKLDDAILKLHLQYGRPFFIFKSDYVFLEKIQKFLLKYSPTQLGYEFVSDLDTLDEELMLLLFVPKKVNKRVYFLLLDESHGNLSNDTSYIDSDASSQFSDGDDDDDEEEEEEEQSICASVFGSLPSRILPHLYLGSLSHANNLPLLNAMGITKVVSVGEKMGWICDYNYTTRTTETGCVIMEILDSKSSDPSITDECMINSVMKISNINDDGIGTLTKTIDDALKFINDAYVNNEKILVHCQVGVSRSATVCIAEVMKRLNVSLIRAYLYVRVRRLNVIIQPNLKLTYELFKWEENVVKSGKERDSTKDLSRKFRKSSIADGEKERQSFNSLFSNPSGKKNSYSRSSLSTSISSIGHSFDSATGNTFFALKEKEESFHTLRSLDSNQVFMSDEEDNDITNIENEFDDGSESDISELHENIYNGLITNNHGWLREVDWSILCREIYFLNKSYINHD